MATHVLNVDLAKVWARDANGDRRYLSTVAWGDPVPVAEITDAHVRIKTAGFEEQADGSVKWTFLDGFIEPPAASDLAPADCVIETPASRVMKVDFVDVQQGDGAVVETPSGKVLLIDGGVNQLFARYLAGRFRSTSLDKPRRIDAIVVTHGDADHFRGLTEIHASEAGSTSYKRLFIQPERVFHNGLVKRPSKVDGRSVKETEMLGATTMIDGRPVITELVDDLTAVPDEEMNEPFREWKQAVLAYGQRGPVKMQRLEMGDDDAFDFLGDDGLDVNVLGPIPVTVDGAPGLPFLGTPKTDEEFGGQPVRPDRFTGNSASHTINGHSVVLKMTYGRARFLFTGDLNEQAGETLTEQHNEERASLRAEVFKAPHHGSADFSVPLLRAVAPVVSVVSSGDESAQQEYIHPRATLVGSLGKYSRPGLEQPLIFVTEMVAFFETEGWVRPEFHELEQGVAVVEEGAAVVDPDAEPSFFAFSRAAFGIVKIRTDGDRLLVWTNSGQTALKETYAFDLSGRSPVRSPLRRA